jgi:vitamin B12/bleomycin/antimicrobial peptide transport system ATP-binding/permease protein
MRAAWRFAKNYWTSEEKWSAWGLLLAVILLNLGNVYVSVRINEWNNAFYNALQGFNSAELFPQLGLFCVLVVFAIGMSVYALYLKQLLQVRWRRWLTRRYLAHWIEHRAYYRSQLKNSDDNPDQRISEDLDQFTNFALSLSVGILSSVVTLGSFLFILWRLSGSADIPLGTWGTIHIPAYLLWAALLYAGIGTWLAFKIGRPLVPLNVARQRSEADFRFSLVRFRENAENVAFYGGEEAELGVFHSRFGGVFDNFRKIMKRQRVLAGFTLGYTQVAFVFPLVVVSPRYFAKQIGWGGLMQVVNAFAFVQNSLSFIVNSYTDIASWQAATQRLDDFEQRLIAIHQAARAPQQIAIRRQGTGIFLNGIDLDLPDGTPLLQGITLEQNPGDALLITGPSGSGKSTVLRALAGIWPFGRGEIRVAEGSTLFVPQRPYLPLGSLADALRYPGNSHLARAHLVAVLETVGLGVLIDELDTVDNWSQRLSLGEQQRLAFARILLTKPAFLFMDESTSALDEPSEAQLFALLRSDSWRPTIVSVGHRSTLRNFHDQIMDIVAFAPRPEAVVCSILLGTREFSVEPILPTPLDGAAETPAA